MVFSLNVLFAFTALSAAAPAPPPLRSTSPSQGQTPINPECGKLTQSEQNFSSQIMDMNNRTMFCSQFTMQQRQQAMQLMGQPDSSGNIMNADQAVQEVMGSGTTAPMTQPKMRSPSGGCPVH